MNREQALQAVVAGEQAAVYAFGVVGGRLRGTSDESAARAAWDRHRGRRDEITALLVANGAAVPAAAPAYDLGGPVITAAAARRLAARVELACCGPYADWVGAADHPGPSANASKTPSETASGDADPGARAKAERATAAAWLSQSAADAVSWGGGPATFPGLAERS